MMEVTDVHDTFIRSLVITEPNGGRQIYVYRADCLWMSEYAAHRSSQRQNFSANRPR